MCLKKKNTQKNYSISSKVRRCFTRYACTACGNYAPKKNKYANIYQNFGKFLTVLRKPLKHFWFAKTKWNLVKSCKRFFRAPADGREPAAASSKISGGSVKSRWDRPTYLPESLLAKIAHSPAPREPNDPNKPNRIFDENRRKRWRLGDCRREIEQNGENPGKCIQNGRK